MYLQQLKCTLYINFKILTPDRTVFHIKLIWEYFPQLTDVVCCTYLVAEILTCQIQVAQFWLSRIHVLFAILALFLVICS